MTGMDALAPALALPPNPFDGADSLSAGRTIEETGKQFESLFLSLLLKEMRQTLEPDGLFAGDTGDIQGGLFDFYLGKHLADSGGVGLAETIVRQLQPASSANARRANPLPARG